MKFELRPYQVDAIEKIRNSLRAGNKRVMLYSPTGCHARGEQILLANGDFISSENVCVGYRLAGDDGTHRTVLSLHNGRQLMARIVPVKGDAFIVNIEHILSLVDTETGVITDISVSEWLGKNKTFKHRNKLFRSSVNFFEGSNDELPIHPWLLGVMLGDGSLGGNLCVTNPEQKIQSCIAELAAIHGVSAEVRKYGDKCESIHLCNRRGQGNPLRESIRELGLDSIVSQQKFVPKKYLTSSKINRQFLLAGLLDTDGHESNGYYDWISASRELALNIVFLARSLGLAAYMSLSEKYCQNGTGGIYFRVSISGDFSELPTVKCTSPVRKQKKNVLRTGFSVELLGEDEYFGWEIDGNHRYLMSDFTVTHNSGKTEMAMDIIKSAHNKKKRILFIVNRLELINQTSRRFTKSGLPHGIIQGQNTRMTDSNILVCSIQTLAKRGYPEAALIVVDEGHTCAGSKAYLDLITHYKDIPVVALSATPFSKGLGKQYQWGRLFEDMVIAATIKELIAHKHLVDLEIYAPDQPDLSQVKITAGDYNEKDLGDACDKPVLIGNIVEHWIKLGGNKATVCFAVNISHSKHIVKEFQAKGISAEHIDCYCSEDERKEIFSRVTSGKTKIICNVGILTTGVDFPAWKVMILARPTKSMIFWIQAVGRILRPFEEESMARLLDHSGTAERLGFPTDDFGLELDDGKPKNSSGSDKKAEKKLPKRCPSCHYLKPAGTRICPVCKFKPEFSEDVETGEGTLKKITRKGEKIPRLADKGKQQVYSELLAIKEMNEYSSGWVAHNYRKIFNVWPKSMQEVRAEPSAEMIAFIRSQLIKFGKTKESKHV